MEITFDPINFYDAFLTRWLGGNFKASESRSKNDKNYQKIQIFQPPPVLRLVELDKKTHQKNHKKSIFQISINFKASESRSKIENHKKSIFRISANFKASESRSKNEKKNKKIESSASFKASESRSEIYRKNTDISIFQISANLKASETRSKVLIDKISNF